MPKKKLAKKCCMCGKPVFSIRSIYCRACSHFSARMSNERFPPETRNDLWKDVRKKKGYFCHYTEMELNVFDESDPYFLEFDHLVPGNPKKIVKTSAWFNEMKGDLLIKEFRGSVAQLYNYWFKGIKIKKKKFRYWFRLDSLINEALKIGHHKSKKEAVKEALRSYINLLKQKGPGR